MRLESEISITKFFGKIPRLDSISLMANAWDNTDKFERLIADIAELMQGTFGDKSVRVREDTNCHIINHELTLSFDHIVDMRPRVGVFGRKT
jgi:hypothetical protein